MTDKTGLLFSKYQKYTKHLSRYEQLDEASFSSIVSEALNDLRLIEIEHDANNGFLYYQFFYDGKTDYCHIPLFGYYADDEKMMIRLFQKLAEEVISGRNCIFTAELYAGDIDCLRAYHMMQFGNVAESGLRKLEDSNDETETDYDIRVLTKEAIDSHWDDIWSTTSKIITHLRKSPIFYPGREFSEEVYRELYSSEETELIAAFSGDEIVGMIEWNLEENVLMCPAGSSVNVGEAYVIPALRGTGLAEQLLRKAERQAYSAGYRYMWVEHGTANPNARGFWNKYFDTYRYEVVRSIDADDLRFD